MRILRDSRLLRSMLFFPRLAVQRNSPFDGVISIDEGVMLGYRIYPHASNSPLILYYHGNGETVDDYDDLAVDYHQIGASLLVIDYRGYGWSTGQPSANALMTDTSAVHLALPDVLDELKLNPTALYVMGRSLGSISAIHMAVQHSETFQGLIIESGLAHMLLVYFPVGWLPLQYFPDIFGNLRKIRKISILLLVIHGEQDRVLPVRNGQKLYDLCPTPRKTLVRLPEVGHNDLMYRSKKHYFEAIGTLISYAFELR